MISDSLQKLTSGEISLETSEQLFYVEELSDELIKKFNATQLQSYFKGVY